MITTIIYKVINNINGKCYIGQTIRSLKERKWKHKYLAKNGKGYTLHKAIRKYGWNNFKWSILEKCDSKEELDEMEFHYIKQYNSLTPGGYNMTLETCGNLGHDFSGENNPRYGDHRTWDEIHGKEKANELKKDSSLLMKDSDNNIINWKKKHPEYNPMNDEKSRKKLSDTRTGGKNPAAIFEYIFKLPDGKIYKTGCLREFCRDNRFKRHILSRMANTKGYIPRDPYYKGWICLKNMEKEIITI